ncbi:receptor-like protein 7 [Abrus precatorius]|uniref:Receptor-like protein 7 n=1 Tax=Abrus precatorius TaxID=3816 RepID=A0A8B8K302_ABRPR|nr:receptor-like protein 7 [Abrus precatorius]
MRGHRLFCVFLIPFCLLNSIANIFVLNAYCLDNQRSLLLNLKNNLIFNPSKSKKLVLWNQSEDCCQWEGVKCNEGHVIALDLSEESISGGLADSSILFSLEYLQSLNLAFNNIHSVIPSELHKLKNLRYLNLSMSGFEGQIPHEISYLKRLVTIDLSSSFTSPNRLKLEKPNIAMLLQNLTDIKELFLDGVAISSKGEEWCHALSSLQDLRVLSMSSCNLSGPIDSSLSKLHSLSVLKLSHNNMSSTVPESFVNFSNLATLELGSCGLSGSFPKGIFQVPTLKVLDLSYNQDLGGTFPNFPTYGSLQYLNLSNTNFSGQFPDTISNLQQLSTIDLSYCQFNGTLPSSMSKLTQLVHLDLSSNNFTGSLPSFNISKNLTYLFLFHNHLSGVLPPSYFEGNENLVTIDLGFNSFSGRIPSSLFKLPHLLELRLPYNQFSGLFDEFSSSPVLEMLDLSGNSLQGPIPMSIFNLRTLRVIQLSSNKFNGTVKLDMIRRLHNLTTLALSHNNLSIDIHYKDDFDPSPFPKLGNLMVAFCKMRGFPSFLRNQSTLLYLDLAGNEIEGPIPSWIWQLDYVMHLNLSKNSLTNLEGSFWNASENLFLVDLSFNLLEGPFPFIPKLVNYLDYSNNRFSSIIPLDIGNHLPFATTLSLSNNNFEGQIPESFCNASSLHLLDLSYNNFVGMIPKCFATLSNNLRVLNFGGNKLHGHIPNTFPSSCTLQLLDLNDNLLGGTIPESLVNCQKLQFLNLGTNMLTDRFPCFLSNISTLRIMDLKSNKLHGSIECPRSTGNWEMLHIVELASNNFSGAIPGSLLLSWKAMMRDEVGPEFGHFFLDVVDHYNPINFKDIVSHLNKEIADKIIKLVTNVPRYILDQGSSDTYAVDLSRYQSSIIIVNKGLQMKLVKIQRAFTYVDLSNNNFEGPIPDELMQLKALFALNLSNNALSGHIPSSIGNLKNIESLDLSNNSFNGRIPAELASLSFLAYLNLSFNHLVGEIPDGTQIQSFDANSFKGNGELCGPPLTHNCSDVGVHGLSKTPHDIESSIHWNFLSAELGFIFGFGIFILPLILWRRWRLWYSKHVDEMLYKIIPQLDFVYEVHGGRRYKTLGCRR